VDFTIGEDAEVDIAGVDVIGVDVTVVEVCEADLQLVFFCSSQL